MAHACAICSNLSFADRAHATAADSPFRDPTSILEALVKLDVLAGMYLQGAIGRPIAEVARDLNLQWVEGAQAASHGRFARHYVVRHAGRDWSVSPHVRLGMGAGANATARIYLVLHPGDDEHPRQVIVGVVGRKLPDSTAPSGC